MVSMPVSTLLVDWDQSTIYILHCKNEKKTSSSKYSILSDSLIDIQAENYFQVKSINCYLKALSHYNVLANVCRRMKYISSTLAYAEV